MLIERVVADRRRGLVVVVGEKARDQVVLLHHMLSKASVRARPSVLWCYKKDLGFSRCDRSCKSDERMNLSLQPPQEEDEATAEEDKEWGYGRERRRSF